MATEKADSAPQDVETLLQEGIAAARSGQRERAHELFNRVVELDRENIPAWLWLAGVTQDLNEREASLERVLILDPDNPAAQKGLAEVRKKNVGAFLREGIAAAQLGNRMQARDLLTRVIDRDEENVLAWLWLSGVVEDLDEQEICLENVLALDPENEAAAAGLAAVREKKAVLAAEAAAPPEPEEVEERPSWEELEEEYYATSPEDEFADEYLCPACANPTEPDDRRCEACGAKLWVRFHKREERSSWLWAALVLQVAGIAEHVVELYLVLAFIVTRVQLALGTDFRDPVALTLSYLGLPSSTPPEVMSYALTEVSRAVFLVFLLFPLFSVVVTVGLFMRWKPFFFIFLADAILGAILTLAGSLTDIGIYATLTGGAIFIALTRVAIAFAIQDDFAVEKTRVLLRPDPDAQGGHDFLVHGQHYARQYLWAMAALHLQRAAGLQPHNVDAHIALAATYVNLKRFGRAGQSLEEAKRVGPGDPRIEQLETLLASKQAPAPS